MVTQERKKIQDFIRANEADILRDLARLVAIPSTQGEAEPDAPFGAAPKAALDEALAISTELGLAAHNEKGYIGWAELPGKEPEKYLGVIGHLDVVPAGNGWDADPFTLRQKDGWVLGRGVLDDKGPVLLCLYALKYLREQAGALRYPIRVLMGANEETGMLDVEYFVKNCKKPVFCFTPDAEFPVCNGEKGIFQGMLYSEKLSGKLLQFEGGVAKNAVPDRAAALVAAPISAFSAMEHITLEADGPDRTWVRGQGISGHASLPAGTRNAIGVVTDCLLQSGLFEGAELACLQAMHKLHASTDGSAIGMAASDGRFTPLTLVGGMVRFENGILSQSVDIRYPTTMDQKKLEQGFAAAFGDCFRLGDVFCEEPFYIEPDHPAIETLIDTYNEVTGEGKKPFTIGGGTYARYFPLAVSFGPEHNDEPLPPFAGPIHGANEGADWRRMLEALEIYILSLLRLEEIEF